MPNSRTRTPERRLIALVVAACGALAAASLALPFAPLFDPWGWLVWGRELGELDLDTSAGPSWKPLPALICALLAPFGDAAPDLWLLVARAAWLAVPVLAWTLAARLEGSGGRRSHAAGALAAVGVVLAHDGFTSPARQLTGGLSEPMLAALVLGAIVAALERRTAVALGLALAACLLRPEAWPFAVLYAWREVRAQRASATAVALGAAVVPLAWFGPDLLAAGSALEGAERAREGSGSPPAEALEVLGRALLMPPVLLWAGVAALVAIRGHRRDPDAAAIRTLAVGAVAWVLLVAAMAAAGYAGLPRFMAPAAAVVCALGGAGLVALASAGRERGLPNVAAVACALLLIVDLGWRAADVPGELERARDEAASLDRLSEVASTVGPELRACPPISTTDFLTQPPLAWDLEVAMSEVLTVGGYPHAGVLVTGPAADPGQRVLPRLAGTPLGAAGEWEAFRSGPCAPAPQRTSGASMAGVAGALR